RPLQANQRPRRAPRRRRRPAPPHPPDPGAGRATQGPGGTLRRRRVRARAEGRRQPGSGRHRRADSPDDRRSGRVTGRKSRLQPFPQPGYRRVPARRRHPRGAGASRGPGALRGQADRSQPGGSQRRRPCRRPARELARGIELPPIVRAYFDAGMQLEPQPVRLYYLGPYFRSERPQRGRFHEFRQFGIEAIGDASPLLDVEAIVLGWKWFGGLDIGGIHLLLNSIGDDVCRPAYRERLRDYYRPYLAKLSAESRTRFEKNPLRLFDSKEPQDQELKQKAPRMVDHLCQPCAQAFQAVKDGLAAEAIPFTLNPE